MENSISWQGVSWGARASVSPEISSGVWEQHRQAAQWTGKDLFLSTSCRSCSRTLGVSLNHPAVIPNTPPHSSLNPPRICPSGEGLTRNPVTQLELQGPLRTLDLALGKADPEGLLGHKALCLSASLALFTSDGGKFINLLGVEWKWRFREFRHFVQDQSDTKVLNEKMPNFNVYAIFNKPSRTLIEVSD